MRKACACLLFLLLINEFPSGQQNDREPAYKQIYVRAEKLYAITEPTHEQDSAALSAYLKIIGLNPPDTAILTDSYYKAGIYFQSEENFLQAIPYLQKSVILLSARMKDSALYLPLLYLGNSYYNISSLDSAMHYYQLAEKISLKYQKIPGIERLYNTLGAVNYESGNYQQSNIYFEKALETIRKNNPNNIALLVTYINNLASSFSKSGEYKRAMDMYTGLLKYNSNKKEVIHNIGLLYLKMDSVEKGIAVLKSADINDPYNLNDIAYGYLRSGNNDSAENYIRSSLNKNMIKNGDRKNISAAVSHKLYGNFYKATDKIDSAIRQYHEGIKQLIYSFNSPDPRINPEHFEGQFSVMELFDLLASKADAFALKYNSSRDTNDLKTALNTYDALDLFTDYVLKTYESAEARLYLNNIKNDIHNQPINICFSLYKLTNDKSYIERAFQFDERNKATVLSLAIKEAGIKTSAEIPDSLVLQEKRLKQKITRLSLQMSEAANINVRDKINTEIRDESIQLYSLQRSFEKYDKFKAYRFLRNNISVKKFQSIIPDNTAVLSYHMADSNIVCFIISGDRFDYFISENNSSLREKIIRINNLLRKTDENNGAAIDGLASDLYSKLILPVKNELQQYPHLMIIPDDELNLLPFGILKDSNGNYLVDSHDFTYNYSCGILQLSQQSGSDDKMNIFAMAPFVSSDNNDLFKKSGYPVLKESENEIASIMGDKVSGNKATKQLFLENAGKYTVIHLATHASVNDIDPGNSFIAFYPDTTSDLAYKLYSPEISNLTLDKTNLIFLSACETGAGKLVKGEGVLSLTRAFAYAGCPNTIASLWKTNDLSTSLIVKEFYRQLQKGKSISGALRSGIKSYWNNENVPAGLKTPAYWAHLRLVGNFSEVNEKLRWEFWVMVISAIVLLVIVSRKVFSAGK